MRSVPRPCCAKSSPARFRLSASTQQPLDDRQHAPRRARVSPVRRLPARTKISMPELVLELADLPAHAGLRGVQRRRHLGQVEAAAHRLAHRSQLLEVQERLHGERMAAVPCYAKRSLSEAHSAIPTTQSLFAHAGRALRRAAVSGVLPSITPPPRHTSPSYSTADWPGVTAHCGASNASAKRRRRTAPAAHSRRRPGGSASWRRSGRRPAARRRPSSHRPRAARATAATGGHALAPHAARCAPAPCAPRTTARGRRRRAWPLRLDAADAQALALAERVEAQADVAADRASALVFDRAGLMAQVAVEELAKRPLADEADAGGVLLLRVRQLDLGGDLAHLRSSSARPPETACARAAPGSGGAGSSSGPCWRRRPSAARTPASFARTRA